MNFAVKIVSFLSFLICYERHLGPNNSLLHVIISFFFIEYSFSFMLNYDFLYS